MTTATSTNLVIQLNYDTVAEDPTEREDEYWTVISFERDHIGHTAKDSINFFHAHWLHRFRCGTAYRLNYSSHGPHCDWSLYDSETTEHHITSDWVDTRFDGLLVTRPRMSKYLPKDKAARYKAAETFIEMYARWCNGDCYCFKLANEDWWSGTFYGDDGLKDELQIEIDAALKENPAIKRVLITGDARWLAEYLHLKTPEGVTLYDDVEDPSEFETDDWE